MDTTAQYYKRLWENPPYNPHTGKMKGMTTGVPNSKSSGSSKSRIPPLKKRSQEPVRITWMHTHTHTHTR